MPGRVTVTGATGLVGRALCAELRRRGVPLRVLSRTAERAREVAGADEVVIGSVADPRAVAQACEGSDAIVHLARSSHDLADLCRYDYPALHSVIAAANSNGAELHIASSQAVFGDAPDPPPLLDDRSPVRPSSAYGTMKAAWEWTARSACAIPPVVYRMPVVVPRRIEDGAPWLRELFGTGFCEVDTAASTVILRPRDARFRRTGISFVHVEDVAETIAGSLFRPAARGTVAMLADPTYVRFRDLAEAYAGIARGRAHTVLDAWDDGGGEPDVSGAMFRFDTSGATARLGFESRDGLPRLMAKAARYFAATLDVSFPAARETGPIASRKAGIHADERG